MNKRRSLMLIIMCVFFTLFSFYQKEEGLDVLLQKIDQYTSAHASEKVHLQFDKPYYSIGDEVWFKGYVVDTRENALSTLSSVLYIDVIDDAQTLRKTITMPLINGLCYGNVQLTDSLVDEGIYHIKAYTRWMLNFDEDFIFKKDIVIGDANTPESVIARATFNGTNQSAVISLINLADSLPLINKNVRYSIVNNQREIGSGNLTTNDKGLIDVPITKAIKNKDFNALIRLSFEQRKGSQIVKEIPVVLPDNEIDLQFFPESGMLINGLRSKVGFKCVSANGLGLDVSGYIVDKHNEKVIDFSSEHLGMGVFALLPAEGDSYTAVITNPKVSNTHFNLPEVHATGFSLALNHLNGDSLTVRVAKAPAQVVNQQLTLMALQNGVVKLVSKVDLSKGIYNSIILKNKFNTGITQFTLFSADFKPLAERLIFIERDKDQIRLDLSLNKKTYGKREKIEVNLKAFDKDELPVTGSFSVSATNNVGINEDQEQSILSDFLLKSDLKGYIEKPNYYFNKANNKRVKYLDYLLLTQGWRRFNWTEILSDTNGPLFAKYKPQKGLELSGFIANAQKKPIPAGQVELFANTNEGLIATNTTADSKGNFTISDLSFTGAAVFTAKGTNKEKNRNVNIYFDKPVRPESKSMPAGKLNFLDNEFFKYLRNTKSRLDELERGNQYSRGIMLKEVEVKGSYLERNAVKGSKKLGNSVPDIVINKDKLGNATNLVQVFYGLPGIDVVGRPDNAVIVLAGRNSLTGGPSVMKVILDGTEVAPEILKDIPPASVEGIEILKRGSAAIYNALGVIVITSKAGTDVYYSKYALNSYKMEGYQVSKDFYAPAYDLPNANHDIKDYRTVIFWKPDLVTNEKGRTSFSFFASDQPGNYKIIIEGLDINGRLARSVSSIEVK